MKSCKNISKTISNHWAYFRTISHFYFEIALWNVILPTPFYLSSVFKTEIDLSHPLSAIKSSENIPETISNHWAYFRNVSPFYFEIACRNFNLPTPFYFSSVCKVHIDLSHTLSAMKSCKNISKTISNHWAYFRTISHFYFEIALWNVILPTPFYLSSVCNVGIDLSHPLSHMKSCKIFQKQSVFIQCYLWIFPGFILK